MAKINTKQIVWAAAPVAALVIIAAVLVLVGVLSINVKRPDQKVLVNTVACSDELISRFNKASNDIYSGNLAEGVKKIDEEVANVAHYEDDPDCVYVRAEYASLSGNSADHKKYYDRLVALAEDGHHVTARINSAYSLESMKAQIESATTNE